MAELGGVREVYENMTKTVLSDEQKTVGVEERVVSCVLIIYAVKNAD